MAREQTSFSTVKDWTWQVCLRFGWSIVTTESLSLLSEAPIDCAPCQELRLWSGITIEADGSAKAMVTETRVRIIEVRMRRMVGWVMDDLLKLCCLDKTRRCASGGPSLGQFRECHRL